MMDNEASFQAFSLKNKDFEKFGSRWLIPIQRNKWHFQFGIGPVRVQRAFTWSDYVESSLESTMDGAAPF